ncbi:hypothetical protein RM844_30260 [Streptomyces sp. DSM 44915]|uniref:Uncharacterized protein n=1 Tax=Streptomyces chisholmiae TaxID=3075540 RepID=A0ABU2JZY6_9ACTN|nr:hypothetical protein [Streptomyces sp. DSM 44915]MDT0270565.1 hypothetical protein [Streptomyces sp. DSM 44915]
MPAQLLDIRISQRDLDQLHAEIEQYLSAHAPVAPPSGSRVDDLIRQAGIVTGPAPRPAGRIARAIRRHRATARQVSVAEHLEVTLRIMQIYGWAQNTTWDARRRCCIVGAQTLAVHLGYGDRQTAGHAGDLLNRHLNGAATYVQWQNNRWRTFDQVQDLLRAAANTAQREGI